MSIPCLTDEVYGDIEQGSHTETDLLKPSNPYSATKAAADMLVLAWARTYKVLYVIVRPSIITVLGNM
jgi:dTDP-glucose 4,6-dehydratase